MSKRLFFPMFKRAWDKSFTEENIQHAFQKPGIWPVFPDDMLQKVTRPSTPPRERRNSLKTPLTSKAIRHFKADYRKSPTAQKFSKLLRATETLSTKVSILKHENQGLRKSIILEKKKRKRGKKLDLCREESTGTICYSPAKVARARAYHEENEAKEAADAAEKEARKVECAAKALKNKQEKEAKAIAREVAVAARQLAKDLATLNLTTEKAPQKQSELVPTKARTAATKFLKAKKTPAPSKPRAKSTNKVENNVPIVEEVEEVVIRASQRGRAIALPTHFK
jgi:hypothetical protein